MKSYEQKRDEAVIASAQRIIPDDELWHNGFHSISPSKLIDSIESAREHIDFSIYDCDNLDRVKTILLKYCKEHGIPLGEPLDNIWIPVNSG